MFHIPLYWISLEWFEPKQTYRFCLGGNFDYKNTFIDTKNAHSRKKLPSPCDVQEMCDPYLNLFYVLFIYQKFENKTLKKKNFAIEMFCNKWL